MTISGILVEVTRRATKNVTIRVASSDKVRVSAPPRLGDDAVRELVESRIEWVRRRQAQLPSAFRGQAGEILTIWGVPHRLVVHEGRSRVRIEGPGELGLRVPPDSTDEHRLRLVERLLRDEVTRAAAPLVENWAQALAVQVVDWRVRHMKTRWGSCSRRKITLNSELGRHPIRFLEYVVVHELVHIIEPNHGSEFYRLMDGVLPGWKATRRELTTRACH